MPPGTGDVQITLTQSIAFTGAVIVTTPHPLAMADVLKGVQMFRDLRVPTLAVVCVCFISIRCGDAVILCVIYTLSYRHVSNVM